MTFPELLLSALRSQPMPLSGGLGQAEAMLTPIIETLQAWIAAHLPEDGDDSEFDAGYRALAVQLLDELDGSANLPELRSEP